MVGSQLHTKIQIQAMASNIYHTNLCNQARFASGRWIAIKRGTFTPSCLFELFPTNQCDIIAVDLSPEVNK